MKDITLTKENIYRGNLILVNADYPLVHSNEYNLIPVNPDYKEIRMKSHAANILNNIFKQINCSDGIIPISGYRSLSEQKEIYALSMRTNGDSFTKKYVALPNHSEHQTGLAIDLVQRCINEGELNS